ncbi:MAG: hypothetical protein P8144_11790, partial [Gammaproteobacteria bacterium]
MALHTASHSLTVRSNADTTTNSKNTVTTLTEVSEALIGIITQMSSLAEAGDWKPFWSLDEQRHALCEGLRCLSSDSDSVLKNRDKLTLLLEKNTALQEQIEVHRQAAQHELLRQRQQRRVGFGGLRWHSV